MRLDGSVTLHRGKPLFGLLEGPKLHLAHSKDRIIRTVPLPAQLLFPRIAAHADTICAVGQWHDGDGLGIVLALPNGSNKIVSNGLAFGVNPAVVRATTDGFLVAVMRSGTSIEFLSVSLAGEIKSLGTRTVPVTSQGIRCFVGEDLLMSDPVHITVHGRGLSEALRAGAWWVGQDSFNHRIVAVRASDGFAFTLFNSPGAKFPQAVVTPEGHLAVTALDARHVTEIVPVPSVADDTIGRRPTAPPPPPLPPPPPPMPELIAPNKKAVVEAVIADHPEVNTLDEEARAVIVDWAAQRLNAEAGKAIWGRKSRGKPVNGKADRPNTDGLTFLRDDGLFEIYDVIGGGNGKATWEGYGPFKQGENGYWAPPQLGPESGTPNPPPPPPPSDESLDELRQQIERLKLRVKTTEDELFRIWGEFGRVYRQEFEIVEDENAPEVSTEKTWRHAHKVRLKVVKK